MAGHALNTQFLRSQWSASPDAAKRSYEMRMSFGVIYAYRRGYPARRA
jgi:hypothetical protein